jgi:hypothetical protein
MKRQREEEINGDLASTPRNKDESSTKRSKETIITYIQTALTRYFTKKPPTQVSSQTMEE